MASEVDDPAGAVQRRCGMCGYALEGLPDAGRCPECGGEYHPLEVVLWGRGRETVSGVVNAAVVLGWVALVVFVMLARRLPEELRPYLIVAAIIVPAGVLAYWLHVRWRAARETGDPEQVRIEPRGFAQRTGPGPVELQTPRPSHSVELRRYDFGRRMIVHVAGPWYGMLLPTPGAPQWTSTLIHADVACDEETWQRLLRVVRGWNVRKLKIRDIPHAPPPRPLPPHGSRKSSSEE